LGVSVAAGPAIDVIEFLWASLALFEDEAPLDTATAYRPVPLALHTVAQARERILRRLNDTPDGAPLDQLLPEDSPDTGDVPRRALRRRSGWAATFVAGLELAKQGDVVLGQGGDFEPIHVAPA
jgi:segregation and condensation protein A